MEYSTVYLSWKSPSRLFKKRDKEFFRNIAAIVFLLLVILFFAREFLLIFAVVSLAFLIYVFATVPPEDIPHKITSLGIETGERFYPWETLKEFWFENQWDKEILVIATVAGSKVIMILDGVTEKSVKDIMTRFLPMQEEPKKSFVDTAASWLSKKVPLEKTA
jgi:hypothetical protein